MFKIPAWDVDAQDSDKFAKKGKKRKISGGDKLPIKNNNLHKKPEINGIKKPVLKRLKNVERNSNKTEISHVENNLNKTNYVTTRHMKKNSIKNDMESKAHKIANVNKTIKNVKRNKNKALIKGKNSSNNYKLVLNNSDNKIQNNITRIGKKPRNNNDISKKIEQDIDSSVEEENLNSDLLDEVLINAKKRKLNKAFEIDNQEDLLFGETNNNVGIVNNTTERSKKKNKSVINKKLSNGFESNYQEDSNMKESSNNLEVIEEKSDKTNKKNCIVKTVKKKLKIQSDDNQELEGSKDEGVIKIKPKKTNKKDYSLSENKVVLNDINKKMTNNNVNNRKKEKIKKLLEQNNYRSPINVSGDKLRERMLERLKAAQFRYLNEKLYTSSGTDAQKLFQSDSTAFQTYHEGYQQQLKKWPVNPLDFIVKRIQKMPKSHMIADMGCGEAALSKRVPHKVRSFDLVSTSPDVEACDMAHTPLLTESTEVAVFCLALMGTDLTQYLVEANRILKIGGHLLIAEVESRFDNVENFTKEVERLGFKMKNLDKNNNVFFFMEFIKIRDSPVKKSKLPAINLKPCMYKKR